MTDQNSQQPVNISDTIGSIQLIVFKVGKEEYGLEIEKVQEIIRLKPIKKLPRTPNFILGVMNLRGNIIPVVGLREKFAMQTVDYDEFTRIIVVNHRGKMVGMVVDDVNKVESVNLDSLESNPDMLDKEAQSLVRGVARINQRIVFLVELDYLLNSLDEIKNELE